MTSAREHRGPPSGLAACGFVLLGLSPTAVLVQLPAAFWMAEGGLSGLVVYFAPALLLFAAGATVLWGAWRLLRHGHSDPQGVELCGAGAFVAACSGIVLLRMNPEAWWYLDQATEGIWAEPWLGAATLATAAGAGVMLGWSVRGAGAKPGVARSPGESA